MDRGQSRNKSNAKTARGVDQDGTFFCKEFNQSSCNRGDTHSGTHKGRKVTVSHICAKCWLSERVRRSHSERDAECPHFKPDA